MVWPILEDCSAMSTVTLELEDELVSLLHQSNLPVRQAARELMVLELYRQGKLSSGKAAELLGMTRWGFVPYAARLGIPYFDMTEDEWEAEHERSQKI
jgi:predicted HTH domain antitoxin